MVDVRGDVLRPPHGTTPAAVKASLFCHLYLCPDLSFNLSKVLGSFWLASLFLQVSSLVTKIKDLRDNRGHPLPALLAKKFSCFVSYCLVEVGDHGVIYQSSKRCKSTTYSCLESTHHWWIFQLLEVKPDSWLGWFPWVLKACLESHHHHFMVASISLTFRRP